jgi:SH3-like domain-containing protein
MESLADDTVYGRKGPSREHAVDWVYARKGLPVRVVDESAGYRKVEDPAGGSVWIHESKLAAKQTVFVRGATARGVVLLAAPRPQAKPLARMQNGVVAGVVQCVGGWRKVSVEGREGWVDVDALWGATGCDAPG